MDKGNGRNALRTICVVLPTYNEAANITTHLDRVYAQAKKHKRIRVKTLVVDDNSPDGTAKKVLAYQKRNRDVHLLLRLQKEGLGRAYVAGMRYALDHLSPDVVYSMDSDGQHDPKDIFRLLAALEDGADFAIGSRYVTGGKVSDHWGLHRKIVSACASTITRKMLGLGDIKDCSGGFRAIRASLLRTIPLEELPVKGYAFQAVLLEEALYHGAQVVEVPIAFADRTIGESKMRISDFVEGGTVCFRVRAKRIMASRAAMTRKRRAVHSVRIMN